jgi:hypothetical protein
MNCNLLHRKSPRGNAALPTMTRAGSRGGG